MASAKWCSSTEKKKATATSSRLKCMPDWGQSAILYTDTACCPVVAYAGGDLFITSLLLFVDQLAVAVASNQARITNRGMKQERCPKKCGHVKS